MPAYKTVITVGDVEDKLTLGFTSIEVWASYNEGGTYEEMTAPAPLPAKFYSAPSPPVLDVAGYSFGFSIDGFPASRVTFPSLPRDWSLPMIATRMNEIFPGLASVDTVGRSEYVTLSSVAVGRSASVACTYSENPDVFPVVGVLGRDGRPVLQAGKYIYDYSDPGGKDSTRYKWRFSANGANPVSGFSFRSFGKLDRAPAVPVSLATARFVGLDGQPLARKVYITESALQGPMNGYIVGSPSDNLVVDTDSDGFLQVLLVRGMRVLVAVEGTSLVREITVPNAATFDLLAAVGATPDQFSVQTVPPLLTRRSL